MNASATNVGPLAVLRRFAQTGPKEERCDLCNARLAPEHRHLLEMGNRIIHCSCDACEIRFQWVMGGRFKLIPRDVRPLPELEISDAQWDGLALPINLAFFFHSTPAGKMIALYPSPAGAMESLLPLETWKALVVANPVLDDIEPDVEALLVNRVGESREYFIAPIDKCYELAGLIRTHWRGLHGGDVVWGKIDAFFARLELQTVPARNNGEPVHA